MSALTPTQRIEIQNDSGMLIPPRSVVVVISVEIVATGPKQETKLVRHVTQYSGQTGNIFVTGASPTLIASRGSAFSDQSIFVAIGPPITGSSSSSSSLATPTAGQTWGPISGQWYIGPGGTGFTADAYTATGDTIPRAIFYRQPASSTGSSGSSGSGGTGCGCCECYDCITDAQATYGGCAACPNGATITRQLLWGQNAFSDSGGTSSTTTMTQGQAVCSGSSSSSSTAGGSGGACSWYSCPVSICQPASSSSSSSSSSASCGTYQLIETMSSGTDALGNPIVLTQYVISFTGVGTDWMAAGT